MNRLSIVLVIVLLLSVGFNLFLWYGEQKSQQPFETQENSAERRGEYSGQAGMPLEQIKANLDVDPLRRLLKQGEYIELGRRLQDALRALPNNTELLLMEAEYTAKTQSLSDAVLNYYKLLERPLDKSTHTLIQQRIKDLVEQAVKPLQQEQQWDLLAQLMEPLYHAIPSNQRYALLLAEAYGRQEDYSSMENTLASLGKADPRVQTIRTNAHNSWKRNKSRIERDYRIELPDEDEDTTLIKDRVGLIRAGDQFVLDLTFGETPVRLLLDTGASMTAISARTYDRLAEQYESEFIGVFDIDTAAGVIQAPIVTFDKVALGQYVFKDLAIIIMPTDPFNEAEGLLGMNILKSFDFKIDQKIPALILKEF